MNAGFLRPLFRGGAGRATARLSGEVFRDESGSAVVEFTILAPLLILLWVGVLQFGPILQNQVILQDAVHQGAQTLAASRTDANVYSDTIAQVEAAAGSLWANTTVTVSICNASGGSCSACSTNSTCAALMRPSSTTTAQGDAAQVSATYPCVLTYKLFNLGKNCSVSASESALIQ